MTVDHGDVLAGQGLFQGLTADQRSGILAQMKRRDVERGQILVREGDASESMYIVLHGSFDVVRAGDSAPIAQIHAGELIGEIGFLADTPRTATAVAIRDAAVLELDRAAYDHITATSPQTLRAMLAAVSARFGATSAQLRRKPSRNTPKTVAIVPMGRETVPPAFFAVLRRLLEAGGATLVDRATVTERFGANGIERASEWLNRLEHAGGLVVYFPEDGLTDWTAKCIRQADWVVMVTTGAAPTGAYSPVETFICDTHDAPTRRMVRIHPKRISAVEGTGAWLDRIPAFMHHHVSLEDEVDIESLIRFLTGRAIGFVGGGGGGFGPAHVGVFKAFRELGIVFDIYGGTSVGSAMLAGLSMLLDPERIDLGTHRIFVEGRSFKRPTWPRYGLLDHKPFDAALAYEYGASTMVEDCWRPFFAVATNLSTQRLELIRRGPLWQAVRASCAIPGILPPFFTEDGMMLVDGGMMDNAPLDPMRGMKTGPNLIVHFGRTGEQRFNCSYDSIPGRGRLIASMLNPFTRLPRAPAPLSVLWRSLLVHQRYDLGNDPNDLVLRPPTISGSSVINFDNHAKVFQAAYAWAREQIAERLEAGDSGLAAIVSASKLDQPRQPEQTYGAAAAS